MGSRVRNETIVCKITRAEKCQNITCKIERKKESKAMFLPIWLIDIVPL